MVRVHCSKDTLDAQHARSDVVLRSRKVVKSITAHIGDRAIRALRKRLRLRSACSAAPASRASKPDMDGLKSASSFTAGVWRRNEEKWRLFLVGGLRGRLVGIFFHLGNDFIDAGNDFGGLLGRGVLS